MSVGITPFYVVADPWPPSDDEYDPYIHDEPEVAFCVFDAIHHEWLDVPPEVD